MSQDPFVGKVIDGRYEIQARIGEGGMGVVYKARQVSLNRFVALKMLGPHASAFPGIAERIRLEAEAAGSLHHPNIVTIYDVGEHDGQPFFSMELIEGASLARFISADGFHLKTVLPADKSSHHERQVNISRVLSQIARAVDHAHKHGVLHRDLKPANILIDTNGEAHLTDFGLAKLLGRTGVLGTASGAIMGTPAYMAPEQAAGDTKHASIAADIYSLGAILYEMLTGHPPFRADTPLETLRRVVEEDPKHPTTFNSEVDRDMATICLKCLQKKPQDRYSTAMALAEDLERWSRGEPIEARPLRLTERFWRWCRRQPFIAGLTIGLFLLLAAVALLGLVLFELEKTRLAKANKKGDEQKKALLDRNESIWQVEGRTANTNIRSFGISPEELALLTARKLEGTEGPVILGLQLNPMQPPEVLQELRPLAHYMQTNRATAAWPLALGVQIYTTRLGLVDGLSANEVDLMRADPAAYVLARQQKTGVIPLLQQVYSGSRSELHTAIFVRENSGITNLEQLNGKSFAFGEQGSAMGDYLPKAALVTAGLRSGNFPRATNLHSKEVIAAVKRGSFDAGVADLDDISHFTIGISVSILTNLYSPNSPWVATRRLDSRIAEAFKNALLSLRDTNVLTALDYKLIGFQPVQPSDYDALEQAIEKAQLFDQPH